MRCFFFILFLSVCTALSAQNDQEYPTINAWLELGTFRITPTQKEKSAGVDIALKTQVNRVLVTIQYQDCFDTETSHGYFDIFTDDNHYHAGNILLGITNKKCSFGHLSLSSGLGLFWGYFEDYDREYFTTIGLPVEAAISLNLFPFVGLNLKSFANINSSHSFIGFGMDIQIGKLRDINWSNTIRF